MLLLFFFSILFCRHRCRRHTYSLAVFPSLCLSLCRLALHLYWQTHSLSLTLSAILSRIVHAYTRTHVQRHAYMCTFICISMQMSKRRQHRHIALFHLPPASQSHSHSLSLCLHQPLRRICGECSGFCLCRNCSCRRCCCYFIFGSGICRATRRRVGDAFSTKRCVLLTEPETD